MKRGFSAVSAILLVLLMLVLGAGGYTAYQYFTDTNFNFYGLMSRGNAVVEEENVTEEEEADTDNGDEAETEVVSEESGMTTNPEDASRQADLNNIITVVETYASDNGEYPQGTGCVDEMEDLKEYFKGGELPADDAGEQVFETADGEGSISCPGGYLFQDFGDGEYLVWAKVDDDANGNSEYFVTDKAEAVKGESGQYFFHGSIGDLTGSEEQEDGNSLMNLFSGNADNGLDIRKMADINDLFVAVEIYNSDNMGYPQKTACVDQMDELKEYLRSADQIFEEGGKAVFETEDGSVSITCEGGFLYQSFGQDLHILWTTVSNEENGNMQYFVTNQADVVTGDEGRYFVINRANSISMEMLPFEGEDVAPVQKTGVPRGVSRTAQ